MATQDNYIKTAFRIPRALHSKILASAEEKGRSMNAEIIDRLERSFYEASLPGLTDAQLFKVRDEVIKSLYSDFVRRDEVITSLIEQPGATAKTALAPSEPRPDPTTPKKHAPQKKP